MPMRSTLTPQLFFRSLREDSLTADIGIWKPRNVGAAEEAERGKSIAKARRTGTKIFAEDISTITI